MGILTLLRNAFGRSRKARAAAEPEGAAQETATSQEAAAADATARGTVPARETVPPASREAAPAEEPKRLPSPAGEPEPASTTHIPEPREEHDLVAAAFDNVTVPRPTRPEQREHPAEDERRVAEPTADESAAAEPVVSESAAAEPAAAEPVGTPAVEEPAAAESETAEPTVDEPAAAEPTLEESAVAEPVAEPAVDEPAAAEPPVAEESVTEREAEPEPVAEGEPPVAEEQPTVAEERKTDEEPVAEEKAATAEEQPVAADEPKTEAEPVEPVADEDPATAEEPKTEAEAEAEPVTQAVPEAEPEAESPRPQEPVAEDTPEGNEKPQPQAEETPEPQPEPEAEPAETATPDPKPEPIAAAAAPEPEAAPEPAAADGEPAPQGPPAADDESRTGGAGGDTSTADGEAEAEKPGAPATPATDLRSHAPGLTTAYVAAGTALEKHDLTGARAKVHLVLDRSASMRPYYKDGSAQALAEQTLALAAHLDPEATVRVVFFSTELDGTTDLTLTDHENKIDTVHAELGRMGRTSYHVAVEEVIAHHTRTTDPGTPALVIFQTDGAPDAKTPATQALTEAAKNHPSVFFSFVAFGDPENKAFDYLRKLKTPNTAHFLAGETPRELTDKEFYEAVLADWRP